MAGEEKISGPLDVTRANLYEIRNLIQSICDRLGVPPPQTGQGTNPVAAEPSNVIDRASDAMDQSRCALSRLVEVNDFIFKI